MGEPALQIIRNAMEGARAEVGQAPPAMPYAQGCPPPIPKANAVIYSHDECWLPAGFPRTAVAAGAGPVEIQTEVRKRFLPRILRIPARISGAFVLTNIEIGTDCYRISNDPYPADTFSEETPDWCWGFRVAQVNDPIILSVTSIAAVAVTFEAMMLGPPC